MAMQINHTALIPVRARVTSAGTPVSATTQVEVSTKDLLIAAFQAIPNQSGGTATVGAIVTALQTLP